MKRKKINFDNIIKQDIIMKRLLYKKNIITFFLTVITLSCYSQNLSIAELINLCNKSNWAEIDRILVTKGWEYYNSKEGSSKEYSEITWTHTKSIYDDKALGWVHYFTYNNLSVRIQYQEMDKSNYLKNINSLGAIGFRKKSSKIEDNSVVSIYENANFIVEIEVKSKKSSNYNDASVTLYLYAITKKGSVYDPDNGKKIIKFSNSNKTEFELILKNGKKMENIQSIMIMGM